jgi:hypothetical protein
MPDSARVFVVYWLNAEYNPISFAFISLFPWSPNLFALHIDSPKTLYGTFPNEFPPELSISLL